MRAECPTSKEHYRFVTGVTVMNSWVVTRWGAWVDTLGSDEEVVDPPSQGNAWFCHECGAQAVVGDCDEDGPDIGPDP